MPKSIPISSTEEEAGGAFIGPTIEAPVWELFFVGCKKAKVPAHKRISDREKHEIEASLEAYESDPTIEWTGFFTDLLFAAVIVRFALQFKHMITDTHDTRVYWETVLWFAGFYVTWLELACVESRFINLPGIWDDVCLYIFCCGVLIMSVQLPDHDFVTSHRKGFVIGFMTCLTSLLILHILYWRSIPRSRGYCWKRIVTNCCSLSLCTLYLIIDKLLENSPDTSVIICYVVLTPMFAWHILMESNSYRVLGEPLLNFDQTVNRFGLIMMLVSGESVLAIILGVVDPSLLTISDYETIFFSFACIYLIKDIYFNSCCGMAGHALIEHEVPGSSAWALLHFPLSISLFALGVGFKLLFYKKNHNHEVEDTDFRAIVVLAATSTIFFGLVLRTAHRFYIFPWKSLIVRAPLLMLGPLGIGLTNVTELLLWCLFIILTNNIVDYLLIDYSNIEIHADYIRPKLEHGGGHADHSEEKEPEYFFGNPTEPPLFALLEGWFTGYSAHPIKGVPLLHHGDAGSDSEEEAEAEKSHGWFNEFCDIILAAIIVRFAEYLKHNTMHGYTNTRETEKLFMESAVAYTGYWVVWLELSAATTRFQNLDGVTDDIFYFLLLAGLILMAVELNPHGFIFDNATGYILGYVICISTMFWMHIYFWLIIPQSEAYCKRRFAVYVIALLILLPSLYVSQYYLHFFSVIFASCIIIYNSVNSFRVHSLVSKTYEKTVERFGMFVMILTGESILALALIHEELTATAYAALLVALLTMFLMKNIYFFGNVSEEGHALYEYGTPGSCAWVAAHGVLGYFLLNIGVGFKMFFYEINQDTYDKYYGYLLTASFFGALWSMFVIRAAHAEFIFPIISGIVRIPISAVLLFCPAFVHHPFMLLCVILSFILVFNAADFMLESLERKPVDRHEFENSFHQIDFDKKLGTAWLGDSTSTPGGHDPIRLDESSSMY